MHDMSHVLCILLVAFVKILNKAEQSKEKLITLLRDVTMSRLYLSRRFPKLAPNHSIVLAL